MEDDDHDELLQCTDDESMSESEDQCLPMEKQEDAQKSQTTNTHSTLQFISTKLALVISSTVLIIVFPLYLEAIDAEGDSYTAMLFTSFFELVLLLIILMVAKTFGAKYKFICLWKPPLAWSDLLKIAILYTLSGFIVVYALDKKKVMCHLQDPIKGIVLVFSLIYYFFFCKKLMGLQRIFSSTIIIVGLFISVDYGLCDEFKCRGYEREHRSDDAGPWKWPINSVWAGVYILGLSLFAGYFTLVERYIVPSEAVPIQTTVTTSLLTTISRIVSFQNSSGQFLSETRPLNSSQRNKTPRSLLHLAFWIQLISVVVVIGLFWIEFVPNVGWSADLSEFFNKTANGISCHFVVGRLAQTKSAHCNYVSLYGWLLVAVLCIFMFSSILFLTITQSAVYTVATMSTSLPLVGIWWSLFRMIPIDSGLIEWAPTVSGELICALLGLPIVSIGLLLLCKCHFKDSLFMKENTPPTNLPTNYA